MGPPVRPGSQAAWTSCCLITVIEEVFTARATHKFSMAFQVIAQGVFGLKLQFTCVVHWIKCITLEHLCFTFRCTTFTKQRWRWCWWGRGGAVHIEGGEGWHIRPRHGRHLAPPRSRWWRGMEMERTGRIQRNTGGCLSQGSLMSSCPQVAAGSCSSTATPVETSRCRGSWRRHRWRGSSGWSHKFNLGLATGSGDRQCGLTASLLFLMESFQQDS